MSSDSPMYETAKSLARNPLGIIALFIVLVYAVASVVISLAKPEFYQNPFHPAVLFLAIFPLVVLIVFAYLVAKHHRNLYAPQDYKDEDLFFGGLKVPSGLGGGTGGAATSDISGTRTDSQIASSIEGAYKNLVSFGFVLIHQTEVRQPRTSPKSGRYRVRVWVESIERQRPISDIASVTYHVWHDFNPPVLSTSDQDSNFDLWLSVYGEFPVLALVTTKSGETFELQRFIDLPGRPPD
jgi:energy-coupling factor transporter transmembrane protein EcfT